MVIKVRSRWRLVALVAGLALLVLTVPAQAEHIDDPFFVPGSSTCASVGSTGTQFTLVAPIRAGDYYPITGVTISVTDVTRTTFKYSISGGEMNDVVVKGSGSNHYDLDGDGTPDTTSDLETLNIPNGNKLNVIYFCYSPGVPIECDVEVSETAEGTTASFTRTGGNCDDGKRIIFDIVNDVVTFIPIGGDPLSTYTGTIIFTKDALDPSALILQYDPDGDGVGYDVVPDCVGGQPPGEDTWCVVSAGAVGDQGSSNWTITWDVYGEGDPNFK